MSRILSFKLAKVMNSLVFGDSAIWGLYGLRRLIGTLLFPAHFLSTPSYIRRVNLLEEASQVAEVIQWTRTRHGTKVNQVNGSSLSPRANHVQEASYHIKVNQRLRASHPLRENHGIEASQFPRVIHKSRTSLGPRENLYWNASHLSRANHGPLAS